MSMRDKIANIIPYGIHASYQRVDTADAIIAMPEISNAQAKIANLNSALAAASGTIAAMRENSSTDQARIRQLKAALQWVKAAAKKSNDAPMFYRADIALKPKP
jgi:multidrug resistance efflux pump